MAGALTAGAFDPHPRHERFGFVLHPQEVRSAALFSGRSINEGSCQTARLDESKPHRDRQPCAMLDVQNHVR
jgi:hypothetical protein